jgi:chromosome segregation ATPase
MTTKHKLQEQIDHLCSINDINRQWHSDFHARLDDLFQRDDKTERAFKAANERFDIVKSRLDTFQEWIEEIDGTVKFLKAVHEQEREAERNAYLEAHRKNTRIWPSPGEMGMFLVGILFGAFVTFAIMQVANQPTNATDVAHQVLPK